MKKYKKEKFKSLEECLRWFLDEKPVIFCGRNPTFSDDYYYKDMKVKTMDENWKYWEKAIEIKTETVTIERWINIYPDSKTNYVHETLVRANKVAGHSRIACVKLVGTYERG